MTVGDEGAFKQQTDGVKEKDAEEQKQEAEESDGRQVEVVAFHAARESGMFPRGVGNRNFGMALAPGDELASGEQFPKTL